MIKFAVCFVVTAQSHAVRVICQVVRVYERSLLIATMPLHTESCRCDCCSRAMLSRRARPEHLRGTGMGACSLLGTERGMYHHTIPCFP
ncbi:hypothetical protein BKA58DRAFT_378991 [Alternaria rosae]|uniref:uncharacterized protein n=1 Tax=Alternaria rosae TaxID=1187941 RepID=UPI001E8E2786|nr:uncharacterized protein BKA58DRAFT_378991 [Alternaria rosae]KAH6879282.1 hypothetical protein BKA58DRAFT_378991 [Alternaria rosae]